MNFPTRLLELAEILTKIDQKRPRQASLRRAVSTAYYSLFHLLVAEYAFQFSDDPTIQASIGRTVNHRDVAAIAEDFSKTPLRLPKVLDNLLIVQTKDLTAINTVARTFIKLQEKRHDADYDLSKTYTRAEVAKIVTETNEAFTNWNSIRATPVARLFLACFQLKKAWNEKR